SDYLMSGTPTYNGGGTNIHQSTATQLSISVIWFPGGWIEFIKDTVARQDDGKVNPLKTIKIFDDQSNLKKQYNLTYFYAWAPQDVGRLFLESVQEVNYINGSTNETNPYLFKYDTSIALPARYSYAQDKWGYYNGKTSNTTFIPTEQVTLSYGLPSFADRRVDSNYTQAGILRQIVYPTRGTLNFEFENNIDEIDSLVGGLRIKRITNYDSVAGKSLVTEYRYNDDEGNSTGVLQYRPTFHYLFSKGHISTVGHLRVSGEPIYPLFSNQGGPISYGKVERVNIGEGTEHKSRHYFTNYFNYGAEAAPSAFRNTGLGVPYNKEPNLKDFSGLEYKTEVY
ncbi:MAG TPA: hypothetical protein VEA37_03460, partial [Flavobacterium sp.]|nr:hypothetical protein [Flavobacterium sp.]